MIHCKIPYLLVSEFNENLSVIDDLEVEFNVSAVAVFMPWNEKRNECLHVQMLNCLKILSIDVKDTHFFGHCLSVNESIHFISNLFLDLQ